MGQGEAKRDNHEYVLLSFFSECITSNDSTSPSSGLGVKSSGSPPGGIRKSYTYLYPAVRHGKCYEINSLDFGL